MDDTVSLEKPKYNACLQKAETQEPGNYKSVT